MVPTSYELFLTFCPMDTCEGMTGSMSQILILQYNKGFI